MVGGSAAHVAGPHGSEQGCGNMLNPPTHNPLATLVQYVTSSAAVSMPTRHISLDTTNKTNQQDLKVGTWGMLKLLSSTMDQESQV